MKMFPTKKSQVIENLINFSAKELSKYSKKRNYDLGPPHKNVSKLSPYLRTRFITEEEVLKIALSKNNIKNPILDAEIIDEDENEEADNEVGID